VIRRRRLGLLALATLLLVTLTSIGQARPPSTAVPIPAGAGAKVLFFSADGMRPDLVDRYAAAGALPTMNGLMATGLKGQNGLLQGFPPNTGVGWYTLSTGTWPSEHGSTNNTFHRTGESNFNNSTSFAATGILQADHIAQAGERAGKTVVSMEWVGSRGLVPALRGPVVDFRAFIGGRGIVLNFDIPGQTASSFGVQYQQRAPVDATGWTSVPASHSPAKETFFTHNDTRIPGGGAWDVYIYDSTDDGTTNYDRALVVNRSAVKNGSAAAATLAQGQWADAKVTLASGPLAGRTGGFYMKLIDLTPDLSRFRLYFTSVQRANASYNGLCAPGVVNCAASLDFEETLNREFPTSTAADFAPLEAHIVDEDTYVEQGLMWKDAHWAYLEHIVNDLGVHADLMLVGNPVTDEFQHQFMGLVTPTDMDGNPNPFFDDVENDNVPDDRIEAREGYIQAAYEEADQTLALARSLMGGNPNTFVSSDHGFAPQWLAVNVSKKLVDLGLQEREQSGNCRRAANDPGTTTPGDTLAKECHAGGTSQIYINLAGRDTELVRDSAGNITVDNRPQVLADQYENVRNQIIAAFQNLDDPNMPGQQKVVDRVFKKEELRNAGGTDGLHPNRSGDVVVVFRPPYQTDAQTPGQLVAPSQFFGQHGYLPDLVDLPHNVNMRATFIAGGPNISPQAPVAGMRAIDVAPTIAFLMGIPEPQNARGKIRLDLLTGTSTLREVDILDISDYHGQLVPLSEAADFVIGSDPPVAFGPTFAIGGSAFLKPWFDAYRAENPGSSITLTAGDAVGATPPISSFFGDKPTIELMNRMGFDLDGLGNHNFDRGEQYLRNELIPLASFKYVSANIVDPATGEPPPEWSKSRLFDFGPFKLGIIGFSNTDIPELTKPGSLGPFVVTDPLAAVNQRAEQLRRQRGMGPIVAIGHLGANGPTAVGSNRPNGTVISPVGPLIELADGSRNVDAVIGDHTNFQVLETRPNGVLVAENLSKGVRFTRVRLVVDTATRRVVYKSADFHKPWTIGVTADPAIQARINELNAQLRPFLEPVIGNSTVFVPRADNCGNADGRTCESLVGDVVTDAMRATYATDFAITNSGGLRAPLTCPTTDNPDDFCPAYAPPPYPITRGQVLTVLPFGNTVATLDVTGTELKTFLERGVSAMPGVSGRFAQISGLCFRYDITQPAGSRVIASSVVRQAADGTCTGAPVTLDATEYSLAINDFMAGGGDGYPNVAGRVHSRELMDEVVAAYIDAQDPPPIDPAIEGRIRCQGASCPTGSNP
jgi:2',3'-cyclic-nucleotide 2'-phosphodiesterase (5'-nucleotidase family)/predicted AlkP superfamily phosphohydrolase/phosphomutase